MTTRDYDMNDFELGRAVGFAWTNGVLDTVGYAGKLVEHRDLHQLAQYIADCIPGLDGPHSPDLLRGLTEGLDDAHGSGIICLPGEHETAS
jgi:hypothetical protein